MQRDRTAYQRAGALAGILALASGLNGAGCIPEQATLAIATDASADATSDAEKPEASEAAAQADAPEEEAASTCPGPCPIVIAEGLEQPWGIAIDSAKVYWTDHVKSTIYSCPRTGCAGAPLELASNEAGSSAITHRGGQLVWTTAHSGTVRSCETAACDPQTIAQDQAEPDQVCLTKDLILWSNLGSGKVMAMVSAWPGFPLEVSTGDYRPGAIESSDNELFWIVQGSAAAVSDGAVHYSNWTGEAFLPPVAVATGLPAPSGIALSATHVFWTTLGAEKASGRVYSYARDFSGQASVVAANQDEPFALAIQGSTLYWLNRGNGTVMACDAYACSDPKAIATGQTQPWSIAVDSTGIFWTDRGARRVMMLPR